MIKYLKRMFPRKLKVIIRNVILLYTCYIYDISKYYRHSNTFSANNTRHKILGRIIAKYHVIEKGLTMLNVKLGFGKDTILSLIEDCNMFQLLYGTNEKQYQHALSVIMEYVRFHEEYNFKLDNSLQKSIFDLTNRNDKIPIKPQRKLSKTEHFANVSAPFDRFSGSRASIRNFSEERVDIQILEEAVKLAGNTPSACNRQPWRVHIVQDKSIIKKIFEIQVGNRGFGHLTDKLVLVTVELGFFEGLNERNDAYINGGMFAMNLLYSLHFYKIGSCPLNWCVLPDQDLSIRKIISIPESEVIIMLIGCGIVPENFATTCSLRNDVSSYTYII